MRRAQTRRRPCSGRRIGRGWDRCSAVAGSSSSPSRSPWPPGSPCCDGRARPPRPSPATPSWPVSSRICRMSSTSGDPDDPRSEAERRQALFEFVYETFDASAWIPQSLFDSNLVTQAVVGDVRHHRRRQGRPRAVARQRAGAGLRHGAQRRRARRRPDAAVDRQLPGVPHRRDRRRRLPGRRHEDVRRAVARRVAEAAHERRVAGGCRPARPTPRRPPTPTASSTATTTTRSTRSPAGGPLRLPRRTSSSTCGRTTARCRGSKTWGAAT